ncbi:hypothetical protein FYK55_07445 [Roseiconus nitratireducens]|uniref:Uncharacterized protein n=1 Tax=Roseiconus nitratireducens TaxID=2605748 RepID=A0A5M6DDK0_9BACT|nr:hypothetical protein [Roseiconus nitratireducens]KAA5545473.1 hypothetical protein FYK55_07445 [Roseiconus nitratireducens]
MNTSFRFRWLVAGCLAFSVFAAETASAQSTCRRYPSLSSSSCNAARYHSRGIPLYGVAGGYGYGAYGGYGSAYATQPLYAAATWVRALASANLLNAQAQTEYGQARIQHAYADREVMENSVQYQLTRMEKKRINRDYRFGHLHERGRLIREAKLAAHRFDPPVIERPVDPATGQVRWPLLLQTSHFAKARQPIDEVFYQRQVHGQINPDHFLPMRDWIARVKQELRSRMHQYEPEDYVQSRDFLTSLIDEARQPRSSQPEGVQLAAAEAR